MITDKNKEAARQNEETRRNTKNTKNTKNTDNSITTRRIRNKKKRTIARRGVQQEEQERQRQEQYPTKKQEGEEERHTPPHTLHTTLNHAKLKKSFSLHKDKTRCVRSLPARATVITYSHNSSKLQPDFLLQFLLQCSLTPLHDVLRLDTHDASTPGSTDVRIVVELSFEVLY